MSIWKELKRRNVYKVGVAYVIFTCLIIQAVAIIFLAQHLPGWTVTFVIVLIITGFPLILLFAWAFEITPEGIKRTKEVFLHEIIMHLTGKNINYIVIGLLILAMSYIFFDTFYLERRVDETKQIPGIRDAVKTKRTTTVLPFTELSPEKDQVYFVDVLSEELMNCLSKISDLSVIAETSSFTFKVSDKTVQETASVFVTDPDEPLTEFEVNQDDLSLWQAVGRWTAYQTEALQIKRHEKCHAWLKQ